MRHRVLRRSFVALGATAVVVLGAAAPSSARPPEHARGQAGEAPLVGTDDPNAIPDRYIVVFNKDAPAATQQAARDAARGRGATIHYEYAAALSGFAATMPPQALNGLRRSPHVAFIEADQTVALEATQSPVTWGLDRIDQRNLPLSNSYTYNQTGAGVKAYIIDTGINVSHNEYGGRAINGYDAVDGSLPAADCNGHGTHVAGTIGGATYGVAKGVTLVAVRVLNCQGSGTNSGVIAGINYVTSNHAAGQPAVANMSLGGGASSAIDNAVNNSIADGVSYAVAAGNGNALGIAQNACNSSPARVPNAITVSATDSSDRKASWANYGTCLDIFAPGVSISSAWYTSNSATNTISGTSMATPHVAGAAALYLQTNPSASPSTVRNQLVNTATTGVVVSPGSGSPNRLLYTLGGTTPPPPPPPPPGCGLAESYSGSLSGTGAAQIHPNGTYFQSPAGTHRGCLRGPASGADFDLALYRWNGLYWARVAVSQGTSSNEDITYNGSAGYYYWRVYSYSGSGSYTFGMTRP